MRIWNLERSYELSKVTELIGDGPQIQTSLVCLHLHIPWAGPLGDGFPTATP